MSTTIDVRELPARLDEALTLVSSGEEVKLGLSSFEQLKTNTPISKDAKFNAMVQRVGKRTSGSAIMRNIAFFV